MRTRLAPTPSGYLHEGNAVNFTLISMVAQELDLSLALRIDDMDATRYRPGYVDDIFDTVEWLEIEYQRGPHDREDFETAYSSHLRRATYWQHVQHLLDSGTAFVCECSRSDLRPDSQPGCIRDCRHRGLLWHPGQNAIKVRIEGDDIVIWRRDDLPAYHLASVIDDVIDETTHIIRGADLEESTRVQAALADLLGLGAFGRITFWHHPLIVDSAGRKLSKSQLGHGPMRRDQESLAHIRSTAGRLMSGFDLN